VSLFGCAQNANIAIFDKNPERLSFEQFEMCIRLDIRFKHVSCRGDGGRKGYTRVTKGLFGMLDNPCAPTIGDGCSAGAVR
jgi:hypothetical protein